MFQKRADREIQRYKRDCVQNRYAILCRHWEKVNKGVEKPTFDKFSACPSRYYDETTGRIRKVTARNDLELESYSDSDTTLPAPEYPPVTSNQQPVTNDSPIVPKGTDKAAGRAPSAESIAEAIYVLYPRKVAKRDALKAITNALKRSKLTELEMQAKVRAYAEAVAKWPEQDMTYVPYPQKWFNQERYMDDPATWDRADSAHSKPNSDAKKKEGGGAALLEFGPNGMPEAPDGWEEAMHALWGDEWREIYPVWERVPPVDQRQVRDWLRSRSGNQKK